MALTLINQPRQILTGVTVTGPGPAIDSYRLFKAFQAIVTGTGSVSATINIEASLDGGTTWEVIGTITITAAASPQHGKFTNSDPWRLMRANVTAITGTGATVNVYFAESGT